MLPDPLSTNFRRSEVTSVSDPIPAELERNTLSAISMLQRIRSAMGIPFKLTSHYRTPAHNARVDGSETSDHMNALAFDLIPLGVNLNEFTARWFALEREGKIGAYDQMIVYPYTTGHVHIGFGSRMRREKLVRVPDDQKDVNTGSVYRHLTDPVQVPAQRPRKGSALLLALVVVAIAGLMVFTFSRK